MTYEKMSRALRYYYDRQIMYHIDGQKLMYKFGDGATESHDDTVTDNLEEAKMDAAWWNEYIEFDGLNRLFFFCDFIRTPLA